MKNKQIGIMAALTAMAVGSALAGNVTVLSGTDPGSANPALEGINKGTSKQREVIRRETDTKTIFVGQSFTLDAAQVAGGGFQLGEIYLKSANSKHFDGFSGDFEINVYKGVTSSASLLDTYEFDMASFSNGDTNVFDVAIGDWVRFSLDGGGINLTEATTYSFIAFWDTTTTNNANTWSFYRDDDAATYTDGDQYERIADLTATSDWPGNAWNGMALASSNKRDLSFYVGEISAGDTPPVAVDQLLDVYVDSPRNIELQGVDLDGDELTFEVTSLPANGTLTGTEPNMVYTATNVLNDSFTYVAIAGGVTSTPATVTLNNNGILTVVLSEVTNIGGSSPTNSVSTILLGGESGDTAQQSLKHTAVNTEALVGQTFTLSDPGAGKDYNLTDIYLKAATSENWDATTGFLEIHVLSNTTTVVETFAYDFANSSGSGHSGNNWLKFSLGSGLTIPAGGSYSFQMFWTTIDPDHDWGFRRDKANSNDTYPDGGGWYGNTTYDPADWTSSNPWNNMIARAVEQDQMFYIAGSIVDEALEGVEFWMAKYGVSDLTADEEPDGMNNLLEYALGGNPTNNDAAAILPTSVVEGDFLNYVYNRQNPADPKLTYEVLSSTDLVNEQIETATGFAGASAPVDGIESATNQVSTTTEGEQFMQLKVEFAD